MPSGAASGSRRTTLQLGHRSARPLRGRFAFDRQQPPLWELALQPGSGVAPVIHRRASRSRRPEALSEHRVPRCPLAHGRRTQLYGATRRRQRLAGFEDGQQPPLTARGQLRSCRHNLKVGKFASDFAVFFAGYSTPAHSRSGAPCPPTPLRRAAASSPTEQSRGRAMAAPFAQSATTNVWVSGWDDERLCRPVFRCSCTSRASSARRCTARVSHLTPGSESGL